MWFLVFFNLVANFFIGLNVNIHKIILYYWCITITFPKRKQGYLKEKELIYFFLSFVLKFNYYIVVKKLHYQHLQTFKYNYNKINIFNNLIMIID